MSSVEELISKAYSEGTNTGEIALSEFILNVYKDDISNKLKRFLEKVNSIGYENASKTIGRPAEDIALEVENIFKARL